MGRSSYLFRQLVVLAGTAGVPLLLLLAYNIHGTSENAHRQALDVVDNHAIAVVHDVEALLQSSEQYLAYLAKQPLVLSMDSQNCDPILAGVTLRRAHYANVLVLDRAGNLVCSSIKGPGPLPQSLAELPWVAQALRADRAVLSKPYLAPIAQKQVVAMARALRDPRGATIGVTAVLFDLESLQRTWHRYRLPSGARLSVIADDGTLIVTNPDFAQWVGKDVGRTVANALRANPDGKGLAVGIDGVDRAFARQPIAPWGWSAFAAFPASAVFANYKAELQRSLIVASLVIAAAAAVTVLLARRLAAPLQALTRTAHAVRDGDTSVHADVAAPGEFGEVAQAFDAMLESLRRAQAALRVSQQHYADLFAHIGMLSFMTDRGGRVSHVNDFVLAATGWQREDLVGQPVSVLLPPEDTGVSDALIDAMAAGRIASASEQPIVTRNGQRLTVRWHHSLLRDEADQVVGLASLGEDVTEARLAAQRERRQLDLYAALSRTNSAILRVDNETELWWEICRTCVEHGHASIAYISVIVDGAVARPVAWAGPAQAFLGGRDLPLDPALPEGRGITATAINSGRRFVVDDAEAHPATLPWRTQGRSIGTRSLAAFPFRRGQKVAGVLTLHMTVPGFFDAPVVALLEEMVADLSFALDHLDSTDRLRATQQRLQEREQQLTGLVETAMDAIITVDAEQHICLFNRAATEMFGVPAELAVGGPLDRFIPVRLREAHRGHVAHFSTTGSTARRMGLLRTLVGLRANGEEFPIEASISKWGEGSAALMTAVIRDATELRQAEEARLARTAAESANHAKSEFLSRMSHELRTPLNAIIGFSQLLQAGDGDPLRPPQAEQVEYIRQAGWHLLALVSDVLEVSRIEAGRLRVEPRGIDGVEALADAMRFTRSLAQQRQLSMEGPLVEGDEKVVLRADPTRLRQVLLNVLSNAVKYNRPHGHVEARVASDGDRVCFIVTDTGLGMTPLQLRHLYEPFNRLGREHGTVEGTGLGLALTRQLVALMDGQMSVHSEIDRGTRVEICLPACDEASPSVTTSATTSAAASATAEMAAAQASAEPAGTVLYIEDNPVNRLLVEQLLARWPLVVLLQAQDGRSGLDLARSAHPDVVLLDMRLPDMTGLQVLAALRADASTTSIRVVALSGNAMPEDRDAALQAGADAYWTKPFDFQQFLREMAACLPCGATGRPRDGGPTGRQVALTAEGPRRR